jgi:hypothetical protein
MRKKNNQVSNSNKKHLSIVPTERDVPTFNYLLPERFVTSVLLDPIVICSIEESMVRHKYSNKEINKILEYIYTPSLSEG